MTNNQKVTLNEMRLLEFFWAFNFQLTGWSGRFIEFHGAMHTLHIVALQCVNACDNTMKQCPPNSPLFQSPADIMSEERCMKPYWKLHSKPNIVSELEVALEKTWTFFCIKSCPKCQKEVARVRNGWWKTFCTLAVAVTKNVFIFMRLFRTRLVWQFWITSKRQVAMIKSTVVLSSLYVSNKTFHICDKLNG